MNNVKWRVWEITKKIRKHSGASSTRMMKCWVKPWLAEKHKLYHGWFSALLLHGKEEFRMLLRMNTGTYEVSEFVIISGCANSWRRGEALTDPESGRKICALILTLKHWSRKPTEPKRLVNAFLRHLERSVGGFCRTH